MPVRFVTPSRASFIVLTAVLVSCFNLFINSTLITHPCHEAYLDALLSGPMTQSNPLLLDWIKRSLVPPSQEPYNIKYQMSGLHEEEKFGASAAYSPSQEFILSKVEEIIVQMPSGRRGFFVEAGAYNGEFLSNTLSLEIYYGWTGLLVEANPAFFQELLTKNRKAWAINVCLNTKPWPSKETFVESIPDTSSEHMLNGPKNPMLEKHTNLASSGLSAYSSLHNQTQIKGKFEVQCIPLYSILKALNVRHVDFLSLDIEKAELGVLSTIPWNEITFTIMAIEHPTADNLTSFLESKGYVHWESFFQDHIFINKEMANLSYHKPSPQTRSRRKKRSSLLSNTKRKSFRGQGSHREPDSPL